MVSTLPVGRLLREPRLPVRRRGAGRSRAGAGQDRDADRRARARGRGDDPAGSCVDLRCGRRRGARAAYVGCPSPTGSHRGCARRPAGADESDRPRTVVVMAARIQLCPPDDATIRRLRRHGRLGPGRHHGQTADAAEPGDQPRRRPTGRVRSASGRSRLRGARARVHRAHRRGSDRARPRDRPGRLGAGERRWVQAGDPPARRQDAREAKSACRTPG